MKIGQGKKVNEALNSKQKVTPALNVENKDIFRVNVLLSKRRIYSITIRIESQKEHTSLGKTMM